MLKLRQFNGAMPFFLSIFLNAFVDLGHKIVLQNTVFKLYDGPKQIILTAFINGLILLPFILLLNPAGILSDKYPKVLVMRISAWAGVVCAAFITLFYYLGWFWMAFAMTFLLAAQSAIYSPAKYGFIKELFGKERLGEGNGVVSALSIVAILAGTFFFSILFEIIYKNMEWVQDESDVLQAVAPLGFVLIACSFIEVIMNYRLKTAPAASPEAPFSAWDYVRLKTFKDDLQPLMQSRVIRLSVAGLAVFWGVGQVMLAAFPAFYKEVSGDDNTIKVQGVIACAGIGIALGSIFSGRFSRNYIETGLLPFGAIGIAVGLWCLPVQHSLGVYALLFMAVGFAGGIFIVPLNALVQFYAKEQELGKTLAANNWVQNVVMLSFLVLTALFGYWGLSSQSLLMLIAGVAVIGCAYVIYQLPQSLLRFALTYMISLRYKLNVQGLRNIPAQGGVLLLGNHISWIDWAILQLACPRPLRFVMIRSIYQQWFLKWFFDLFGCIPIDSGPKSRQAFSVIAEALNRGEVVCLFPEGTISRTGHLAEFRRGFERACEAAHESVVIVPFYMRGLWGSQFSRASTQFKSQSSALLTRDLVVAFGEPMVKTTTADVLKRRVLDLSIHSWNEYVNTLPSISRVWIQSTKRVGGRLLIADFALDRELSGTQALVASLLLAKRIQKIPQPNIGLLMPTSAAGALLNMAVLMAGKTIVNLNYTASPEAMQNALQLADIKMVFTSRRFLKKLEQRGIQMEAILGQTPWQDIEDVSQGISLFEKVITAVTVKCLPKVLLQWWYTRDHTPQSTAAILFSSGSEGIPKGVMLSHHNILANVKQVAEVLNMEERDAIIANLPLFHAFGLTINQFLPLLEGCPMICHPDPTDALGCAKAIARYRATIMCGTSTFLRLYCRNHKVQPLLLESLRVVVTGAEKLSEDVRVAFQLKFNKPLFEGYGATETTPVASVNLPDKIETQTFQVQRGQKLGSVGMPLPGTSCMIVDPETFNELPTGEAGMVLIGGVQVMQGYLQQPEKTAGVIRELLGCRWYVTGDKGYLDEDGFLFIVDRYSRFAKIAGEMVSLGGVEAAIRATLASSEHEIIVVAVPDEKKGEKIVALYASDLDIESLQSRLKDSGLTNLAQPSEWKRVAVLPKLGSGKTDFTLAKTLALSPV